MWRILDTNCSAPAGVDAPQQMYGLWYSYCAKCAAYHAVISDAESQDDLVASVPAEIMGSHAAEKNAGNVIPLRPRARASGKVLQLYPRSEDAMLPLSGKL